MMMMMSRVVPVQTTRHARDVRNSSSTVVVIRRRCLLLLPSLLLLMGRFTHESMKSTKMQWVHASCMLMHPSCLMRQLKSKGEIRVEEKDNGEARIKKDRETNDTFSDVHMKA